MNKGPARSQATAKAASGAAVRSDACWCARSSPQQRRKARGPPVARVRGERGRAPDPKGDERVVQRDPGVRRVFPGQRRREKGAAGDDRRYGAVPALVEVPGPGRGARAQPQTAAAPQSADMRLARRAARVGSGANAAAASSSQSP